MKLGIASELETISGPEGGESHKLKPCFFFFLFNFREDVPAPESRPTSRQSSRRSTYQPVVGYRTHHGLQYNSLVTPQPNGSELGITSTGSINGRAQMSDTAPRLHYDPQYGYAV